MPFWFACLGIGEINVVVNFPAAGRGRDDLASLITRTSPCHRTLLSALELSSALDFAQIAQPKNRSPSREKRLAASFGFLPSRTCFAWRKKRKRFLFLHPSCTLQNPKPLTRKALRVDYEPPRKRPYLKGYRGVESLPLRQIPLQIIVAEVLSPAHSRSACGSRPHKNTAVAGGVFRSCKIRPAIARAASLHAAPGSGPRRRRTSRSGPQ